MTTSIYWAQAGIEDKTLGFAPKKEAFFIAWMGEQGRLIYATYRAAYDAT